MDRCCPRTHGAVTREDGARHHGPRRVVGVHLPGGELLLEQAQKPHRTLVLPLRHNQKTDLSTDLKAVSVKVPHPHSPH